MAQWDGKSKGVVLGYKIFIFSIQKLGIGFAYFILRFVSLYYLIFSFEGTKSSFNYFHKRLGYSILNSLINVYKSYFVFGQTIIDKVAITSGLSDAYTYEHDGGEKIIELLKNKKGGILISAHVGNFEIAQHFFSEVDEHSQISLVTTDNEHQAIKDYLESISAKSTMKFIIVKEDMSHVFEIYKALTDNNLICFTGDRYFEGSKILQEDLLGKKAGFPAGPFLIGSRIEVPVVFVYVMKESAKHYHLYTREANFKFKDAQGLLKKYTESIEWVLKKYPYQWFNYFDFWNELK